MLSRLWKSKTFWACLGGIMVAWGSYLAGELELMPAILATVVAVEQIFQRDGMAKLKPAAREDV